MCIRDSADTVRANRGKLAVIVSRLAQAPVLSQPRCCLVACLALADHLATAAVSTLPTIVRRLGVDAQHRQMDKLCENRAGQGFLLLPGESAMAGVACPAVGSMGSMEVAQTPVSYTHLRAHETV